MSIERFFSYPARTVEYVANVSDRFKYFYLANPKAASTGILRTLQTAEVDGDEFRLPETVHDRAGSPIPKISDSQASPEEIFRGAAFFRFTYVRNPFTRVLSAYLDKIVNEPFERNRLLPSLGFPPDAVPSFVEFLKAIRVQRDGWRDIHWSTQTRLLQRSTIAYHFIGRFETFATTFPEVLVRLGIDPKYFTTDAPRHATNAGLRTTDYIRAEERELVMTIYEADFASFGYGLDPQTAHL